MGNPGRLCTSLVPWIPWIHLCRGVVKLILTTADELLDPTSLKLKIFLRIEMEYCVAHDGCFESANILYSVCFLIREMMPYTVQPCEQVHSTLTGITTRCRNISQCLLDSRVKTKKKLGLASRDTGVVKWSNKSQSAYNLLNECLDAETKAREETLADVTRFAPPKHVSGLPSKAVLTSLKKQFRLTEVSFVSDQKRRWVAAQSLQLHRHFKEVDSRRIIMLQDIEPDPSDGHTFYDCLFVSDKHYSMSSFVGLEVSYVKANVVAWDTAGTSDDDNIMIVHLTTSLMCSTGLQMFGSVFDRLRVSELPVRAPLLNVYELRVDWWYNEACGLHARVKSQTWLYLILARSRNMSASEQPPKKKQKKEGAPDDSGNADEDAGGGADASEVHDRAMSQLDTASGDLERIDTDLLDALAEVLEAGVAEHHSGLEDPKVTEWGSEQISEAQLELIKKIDEEAVNKAVTKSKKTEHESVKFKNAVARHAVKKAQGKHGVKTLESDKWLIHEDPLEDDIVDDTILDFKFFPEVQADAVVSPSDILADASFVKEPR